ncbi:MAG TPA: DMT family transporter [Methanocorpusculum sp.]|nr:DMT family transporter [Methanocorpusculum sp.]
MKLSGQLKSVYSVAVLCALFSAVLNSSSIPFKKYLLDGVDPIVGVVFLQLGIGIGMLIINIIKSGMSKNILPKPEEKIQKSDYKFILIAIIFAAGAAILLNFGLQFSSAATASVLNNFEIVATALLALFIFREKISKRLWIGIILITIGSITLSVKDASSFAFTAGSILVILSCVSYGFRNNLMKVLSKRNPTVVTMILGFGCALLTFVLALCMGCPFPGIVTMLLLMLLGFVTSGLANVFMMYAQRHIGAAKTCAIKGIAPVLAVVISFLVFSQMPTFGFLASLILVIPGLYFSITRNKETIEEKRLESAEEDRNSVIASEKYESGRKYFTAFGCLIIACLFAFSFKEELIRLVLQTVPAEIIEGSLDGFPTPMMIISFLLLLCGVVLLILRRRVLAAVSFIFLAVEIILSQILIDYPELIIGLGITSILFSLMLLTAKGKQKYIFALIHFLYGGYIFATMFLSGTTCFFIQLILAVLAVSLLIYISIASVSKKQNLPLSGLLRTYEKTDFRTCVPVLGYLLIAMFEAGNVIYLISDIFSIEYRLSGAFYQAVLVISGVLILLGLLLLFIGRLGFLPVMFIGCGFCFWALSTAGILTTYCIAIIFLVLGIFAVCRTYSNILRSMLLIFCGLLCLLYPMYWAFNDILPAIIGMAALSALIALYMAFSSICSKPKLPVF